MKLASSLGQQFPDFPRGYFVTLYKNRLQGSLGIYTPFMPITMNAQTTKDVDVWNTLCLQNSLTSLIITPFCGQSKLWNLGEKVIKS